MPIGSFLELKFEDLFILRPIHHRYVVYAESG